MARYATPQRDTQALILKAATETFAAKGFGNASIDEIAGQAGVSKGAVYFHYKDKNALFLASLENAMGQILQSVEGIAFDLRVSAAERIQQLIRLMLERYIDHAEILSLLGMASQPTIQDLVPGVDGVLADFFEKIHLVAEASFQAGVVTGEFDREKAALGSALMLSMINSPGFVGSLQVSSQTVEKTSMLMADFLLNGVRTANHPQE